MDQNRFDRQFGFFGKEGQHRLHETCVTVVGMGGLGSHLIQQLAFLGVGQIFVIDPDIVDITNLNRLIGSHHDDYLSKTPKVNIALRIIRTIDPEIQVVPLKQNILSEEGFNAVKKADFIFGCVDHDGPRLVLTELCSAYKRPYFDLASEIIEGQPLIYGGRVCYSQGGMGCLVCLDLISHEEVQQYFLCTDAKEDERRLYGVPQDDLQGSGPSVVTLNGVIASLAATEFIAEVTGLRKAKQLLVYRANLSKVTVNIDQPADDCFYCKSVYGLGSTANVERFISR